MENIERVAEMKEAWKRIGAGLLAVGLSLALVASVCIPQVARAEPGEKKVKIGIHMALSGPAASTTLYHHYAQMDYIEEFNEKGGFGNGILLEAMWEDDGVSVSRIIIAQKRFQAAGCLMELHVTSSGMDVLLDKYLTQGIPVVSNIGFTHDWVDVLKKHRGEPPYFVWGFPGYVPEFSVFLNWAKEQWTEERPIRLGMIVTEYRSCISLEEETPGCIEAMNAMGGAKIELIGSERVPIATIDTSVEQLRLASKNPDWIFMNQTGSNVATVIKDAKRLGIPQGGVNYCGLYATIDEAMINVAGKEDSEGFYNVKYFPTNMVKGLPGMEFVSKLAKKYRGWEPEKITSYYLFTPALMDIVVEGIREALEKVGYENLDRRAVRDGLFSIKDLDTGLGPPVTLTPRTPWAFNHEIILQVQNGRLVPVTGWLEPVYFPEYFQELGLG